MLNYHELRIAYKARRRPVSPLTRLISFLRQLRARKGIGANARSIVGSAGKCIYKARMAKMASITPNQAQFSQKGRAILSLRVK